MRKLLVVMGLAFLASCGGDNPTVPVYGPSGSWYGTISTPGSSSSVLLTLTLKESAGVVSGTGFLVSNDVTVSGTFAGGKMTAVLTTVGGARQPVTFTATVILPQSMSGTLSGGTFNSDFVSLNKQGG